MSEASDVASLTRASIQTPFELEAGNGWAKVALPDGWNIEDVDWSDEAITPTRSRGVVSVHDADSFLGVVGQRANPAVTPTYYADEEHQALVAILDDDHGNSPGWRQYRVALTLRQTTEWKAWRHADGREFPQDAFAEFVEEHAPEFVTPDAATMLELAQSIEGKTSVNWKVGSHLRTGARQVLWDEQVDAKAGQAGTLEIPDRFTIGLKPFYGAPDLKLDVLLRLRIAERKLRLIPKLVRPDDLERAVFNSVVTDIAAGATSPIVRGPAP